MPISSEQFLTELEALVHAKRFSRHAFLDAIEAGAFSRENLRRWAVQKYLQVSQHIRAFGAIYANCPDLEVRRWLVENLIDEETPLRCGSDSHANLMRRCAQALGATETELANATPIPEVHAYVEWVIEFCKREHFAVGVAALSFAGESQTPAGMRRYAKALKEHYGCSDHDLEFFYVHIGGDVEHSNMARRVLRRYGTTDEMQARMRFAVDTFCTKYRAMHDGFYRVAAGLDTTPVT